MTEHKPLDATADVLPVGLQPTPFGEVWQALQQVAAQVWDVDPSVYRAGIAWMWYALRNPAALDADGLRSLLVAALISEHAPLVKDTQTVVELAEYLRLWQNYTPTYPKLEALYSAFAARVEVRPISDAESQGVVPVPDRRLAFYLRVEDFDADRPLTLDEVYQIAVRATPLGSRPVPYFALVGASDVFAGPASAGLARALWASEPASAPPMSFVVVDSATGAIVHGFNQELTTHELPSIVLDSEDGYETYELPSISLAVPKMVIGVPISGPVQAFWFTDNGQAETVDTELVIRNGLRDADGVKVKSLDNTDYQGANVLAYMEADGDMFTSSDASFTWFGSDSLRQLFVSNQDARGKSAWSVFAAKLFHLSYANTQLPDVQIELPINEVGTYGTSITLPTIDGEYESGGKTWKPSAWDIGAFGSSYSLTADTVAHLIFEEVQQYQEITLYMQSGNKQAQSGVTSSYTGNVNSSYCYQLYTDEACTIPWKEYDYSNDYELGRYVDGVWKPYIRQNVANMPASTTGNYDYVFGRILLDTGELWYVTNYQITGTTSNLNPIVRIYPKGQQVFALYTNRSSVYDNTSINFNSYSGLFLKPGLSGDIYPGNWPSKSLIKVLGSAGNVVSEGYNDFNFTTANGMLKLINAYGSAVAKSVRCALLTFREPVYYAELGSETYLFSGANRSYCRLYEKYPEKLNFEAGYSYKVIIPIALNGSATGGVQSVIDAIYFEPYSSTDQQAVIRTTSSGAFYLKAVWYIKTPIS